MILNKLKILGLIFLFSSCLFFLNACKDISVPDEVKACNVIGDSLNKKAITYSQISKLAIDSVKKNQGCEAYLSALIEFNKISVNNKCFSKSDSANNARLLTTVRCKCTDAFISFNGSEKNYIASSPLPKDTLLKYDNCEALAKALKNFLTVGLGYKCINKADSAKYTQQLASLRCKCNDANNLLVTAQSAFKKTTSPADSVKKKCSLYANAISNYLKIGFTYKCLSKTDSTVYAKTLAGLNLAKSKLSEFKQLIAEMTEEELRAELMRLYNKLPLVKDFYNQDLMTEDERQEVLKTYKSKVYKEYWTSKTNPKIPNNTNVKKILEEYEKIAVFPYDIIDLLIFRVETNTVHANAFGGTSDGSYNTSITSFKKAMKLMNENNLRSHFEDRCKKIFKANNLDYWYIEELEYLFDEGKP